MKLRQTNLRVFHLVVSDENSFFEFFKKNRVILKEFFLLIEGNITETVISELKNSAICFKDISGCSIKLKNTKNIEIPKEKDTKEDSVKESETESLEKSEKIKIYNRPIRSGEEISQSLPVVIFGRVNSGAKLFCEDSLSIYGIIDGFVHCDGEFMILKGVSKRAILIFNGEVLDTDEFENDILQYVSMKNGKIEIKKI